MSPCPALRGCGEGDAVCRCRAKPGGQGTVEGWLGIIPSPAPAAAFVVAHYLFFFHLVLFGCRRRRTPQLPRHPPPPPPLPSPLRLTGVWRGCHSTVPRCARHARARERHPQAAAVTPPLPLRPHLPLTAPSDRHRPPCRRQRSTAPPRVPPPPPRTCERRRRPRQSRGVRRGCGGARAWRS